MAIEYPVQMSVELEPIWHRVPPEILLGINTTESITLDQKRSFYFECKSIGLNTLIIDLTNKQNSDTIPSLGLDMCVIIRNISFFGISDPKFIWSGLYRPRYPEPWYSQQTEVPSAELYNQDRLSWNGRWSLDFTVPVFRWIHAMKNFGWIYD